MNRYFTQYFDSEEDLEDFGQWAFGVNYNEIHTFIGFLDEWNHLHGDELTLDPNNMIQYDAPEMVNVYKKHLV